MKYLSAAIIFILSFFLFMILEYGRFSSTITDTILPVTFASTLTIIFINGKLRKHILKFAVVLLSLMVVFYLFDYLVIANWLGSLGMGIFTILIFSYFAKLIKDGHI